MSYDELPESESFEQTYERKKAEGEYDVVSFDEEVAESGCSTCYGEPEALDTCDRCGARHCPECDACGPRL